MRRWRQDSEFGEGERVPLDREARAVTRARLHMKAFRGPGRLTPNAVAIGKRLLDMLGEGGALFPSIATLAGLEGVAVSTVVTALKRLKLGGFLAWTRRLVRVGNHVGQTSNAYVFRCDAGTRQGVLPGLVLSVVLPERGAQRHAQEGSGGAGQVAGATHGWSEALERVRERRRAALNAAWWARRTAPAS